MRRRGLRPSLTAQSLRKVDPSVPVEFAQPRQAVDHARHSERASDGARPVLTIGLINNMPDSALVGTERQFLRLLTNSAAAADVDVSIRVGSLPEVPRGSAARQRINESYWEAEALLNEDLDALIVTGSEPRAPMLEDEPYWSAMTRLLEWAESSLASSVWSCLAAHMAVRRLDGIQRQRLPHKFSGVYEFYVRRRNELLSPDTDLIRTPHSRWNGLAEDELISRGYQVITSAVDGQVDTFVRQDRSLLVFCQGHPEYLEDTLLREYRRDVNRFVNHERPDFPRLPEGYLSPVGQILAAEFEESVLASPARGGAREFPFDRLLTELRADWFDDAAVLYRNWLRYVADRRLLRR